MKVSVIGAGSWGTAVAGLVAKNVDTVCLWCRREEVATGIETTRKNPDYLVDYQLPENVSASAHADEALRDADAIIFAVPSVHLRQTAAFVSSFIAPELPVLCLTKGIESGSGRLMTGLIADEIGSPQRIAALSGPNHAEEICQGGLSAAVIASNEPDITELFQHILATPSFRIYPSEDMVGVELCGAMKNVMAIICGIAAGSGFGDNTLALIMTRGLAEISRLVRACGGNPLTCMGLAGVGDLIATCTSKHSRNRMFGEAFAAGESLDAYQSRRHMVVEGAAAAASVSQLAHALNVDAPLTFALDRMLWHGGSIEDALEQLASRPPKSSEFYGINN